MKHLIIGLVVGGGDGSENKAEQRCISAARRAIISLANTAHYTGK